MKSMKRFALLAATAIAVAGFATSSNAAKKVACSAMAECSTQCKAGVCKLPGEVIVGDYCGCAVERLHRARGRHWWQYARAVSSGNLQTLHNRIV